MARTLARPRKSLKVTTRSAISPVRAVPPTWGIRLTAVQISPAFSRRKRCPTNRQNTYAERPPRQLHHLLNMPSPPLPTPRLHPLPDPLAHAPASSSSIPLAQLLAPRRRQRPGPLPAPGRVVLGFRPNPLGNWNPCTTRTTIQDRFVLLAPVLVCFRALDSRRPDAIQVEIVIVWRGQRVTGKSTLILERSWACRACCSLLALLRRSTSHRAGTRIGKAGTRLLRRNGKQFRQRP